MGKKAKLVAGSVKDANYERPSSFNLNAEEGAVTHSAKLLTGSSSVSVITPEGSRTNTGVKCNRYLRSSSSPVRMKGEDVFNIGGGGRGSPGKPAKLGTSSSMMGGLQDSPSTQAVGDEEGEKSHVVLNEGSIGYNKFSSTESLDDRLGKQYSSSPQSSRNSSRQHYLCGSAGKGIGPVDSLRKLIREGCSFSSEDCEDLSIRHEAEMKKKDIEIESLQIEVRTLETKSKLLDKEFDRQSDSYFEEVTCLAESLSANQAELSKLRKELVDYEELQRRSVLLEEQAKNATDTLMKLQQQDFYVANIQGTEDQQPEGPGREKAEAEIRDLSLALAEKEEVVWKLKESLKTLTTRLTEAQASVGQNSTPLRDHVHPARLQEAELKVEKLQRQLAGDRDAARAAELEDQVEKLRKEGQEWERRSATVMTNYEELKAYSTNAMESYKTVQDSLVEKEAVIVKLEVSCGFCFFVTKCRPFTSCD